MTGGPVRVVRVVARPARVVRVNRQGPPGPPGNSSGVAWSAITDKPDLVTEAELVPAVDLVVLFENKLA